MSTKDPIVFRTTINFTRKAMNEIVREANRTGLKFAVIVRLLIREALEARKEKP